MDLVNESNKIHALQKIKFIFNLLVYSSLQILDLEPRTK